MAISYNQYNRSSRFGARPPHSLKRKSLSPEECHVSHSLKQVSQMMKIQVVVCILFLLFINGMASAGTADTALFGISVADEPIMLAAAAGSSVKKSISKPPSIRKKLLIRKPTIRSRTTIRKPASRIRKAKVKKTSPDVVKILKKPALPIDTTKTLTPQEEIPDGTKLDPAGEGISNNMPSERMPEGTQGLDPADMGKEEMRAGPDLGGGAAAEQEQPVVGREKYQFAEGTVSSIEYSDGTSVTTRYFEATGTTEIIRINDAGAVVSHRVYFEYNDDNPGQPAGGSDRGGGPYTPSAKSLLDKKFGGKSPIAIDPKTGRHKEKALGPISTEDLEFLNLHVDPATGEIRPRPPKPNESGEPGMAASDDEGSEGKGAGPGGGTPSDDIPTPSGESPGFGGIKGDGTGIGSKAEQNKPTQQDLVAQPGGPGLGGDSEGGETLEEKRAREKGKMFDIPPQMGDPRVGK